MGSRLDHPRSSDAAVSGGHQRHGLGNGPSRALWSSSYSFAIGVWLYICAASRDVIFTCYAFWALCAVTSGGIIGDRFWRAAGKPR